MNKEFRLFRSGGPIGCNPEFEEQQRKVKNYNTILDYLETIPEPDDLNEPEIISENKLTMQVEPDSSDANQ